MDFKLSNGADALMKKFIEAGVTELVDPDRQSVLAKKPWWKFGG